MKRMKSSINPPKLKVRLARAADLPALIQLYRELHAADPSYRSPSIAEMRKAFGAIRRNRDHRILIAEAEHQPIGSLHVLIFRHLGHGFRPAAVIENVVVAGAHRSKGIGEAMMAEADRIARRHRCYKMSLTTNRRRTRAHRFYERLGWRRSHHGYSVCLN